MSVFDETRQTEATLRARPHTSGWTPEALESPPLQD